MRLFLIGWMFLAGGSIWAQSFMLSNPSACMLGLKLSDNNCPEGAAFGSSDVFSITVTDAGGSSMGTDVFLSELRLVIAHTWVSDLNIALVAPGGKRIELSSDNGGAGQNYGNPLAADCSAYVVFGYEACTSIENGIAPFAGRYLPEEDFSVLNDGTDPNGIWRLEICDDIPEDVGTLEYVALVFEPLSCLSAKNVRVLSQDSTTLLLDWEGATACSDTWIEWGPPGFVPGTDDLPGEGTLLSGACSPMLVTGMMPDTRYDVYVRTFCPTSGRFSANSCVLEVETGCLPGPIREKEDFNSLQDCIPGCGTPCSFSGTWYNEVGDDFDWTVWKGGTPTFETGPSADVEGSGKYIFLETSFLACSLNKNARLRSVCMEYTGSVGGGCAFSFDYHLYGSQIGFLVLQLSTDGGEHWTDVWSRSGNQGNAWQKAYVSLPDVLPGDLFQLRFVGGGSRGSKGDMALDNLVFYQARQAGETYAYYLDGDGDGYGRSDIWLRSCSAVAPTGYAALSGDCRDDEARVHPGLPETPCDGLDNNCNGIADDYLLPPLVVVGDTICAGERAVVCVAGNPDRFVFWYASAEGDDLVAVGNCFTPVLPENIGPTPVVYRFYAVESDFTCTSSARAAAEVWVYPKPALALDILPEICAGAEFSLASVAIRDTHTTGGVLRFHSGLPADNSNLWHPGAFAPLTDTFLYAQMVSPLGCSATLSIPVEVHPLPAVQIFPREDFDLCVNSEAVITAVGEGGTAPYSWEWNTGDRSDRLGVMAGSKGGQQLEYAVTLTDGAGCSAYDTVAVRSLERITAFSRSIKPVSTCGGRDGEITLLPLDGFPPFRFAWEDGRGRGGDTTGIEGNFVLGQLEQGYYRFTISDNSERECVFVTPAMLVGGPGVVLDDPVITPLSCHDADDGSICIADRIGNATFRWSTGEEGPCISNLAPGTYSVTVEAGSCTTVLGDLRVAAPDPIQINWEERQPDCQDDSNGSIRAIVQGGNGGYRYAWRSGQRTASIQNLPAGDYHLSVRDVKGCIFMDSLVLSAPELLQIAVDSIRPVSCNGASDGWIRVAVLGGTSPYTYQWDNGQNTALAGGLSPGEHRVTVTDANGCHATGTFSLASPLPLDIVGMSMDAPLCPGDSSGRIAVMAGGGSGGYRYYWNTGDTLSVLDQLPAGTYTLTITDGISCEALERSFELKAPQNIKVEGILSAPTCIGSRDGAITLALSSGETPFEIQWGNGASGDTLHGLAAGAYPVQIRDARGCQLDTTFFLTAPQVFDPQITQVSPTCAGSTDGLLQVNLSNREDGIQFLWNTGAEGRLLTGLSEGNYQVTLSNDLGCSWESAPLLLDAPEAVGIEVLDHAGITCGGEATGFIEIHALGGVGPYTYRWSQGMGNTPVISGLGAGIYTVEVRDSLGCPADTALVISELPQITVGIDYELNERCLDNIANRLEADISGGIPDYRYEWSNGSSAAVLENVPVGDYALTVMDDAGCVATSGVVKIKAAYNPLRLERAELVPISCFGAADGKFIAEVSGGSANYRFHFSNNQVAWSTGPEFTLENLVPGRSYAVTVTDMETGCAVASAKLPLQSTAPLQIYAPQVTDPLCAGTLGGRVSVTVVGGTPEYSYSWLDQAGQQVSDKRILSGIPSGTYSLWVRDANQCVDSLTDIQVNNRFPAMDVPDSLLIVRPVSCQGANDGAIRISSVGGSPPIAFIWEDGYRGSTRTELPGGTFSITLTDSKNCSLVLPDIQVPEPDAMLVLEQFPEEVSCYGGSDGALTFFPKGGIAPYQVQWGDQELVYPYRVDSLSAGSYPVQLSDAAGCTFNTWATVAEAPPLRIQFGLYPESETGGIIEAVVTGGRPPYQYHWNTGDTTARIANLDQGVYGLTVSDVSGCATGQQVLLVSSTNLPANAASYRIFPNPAVDMLYIEGWEPADAGKKIILYNQWGVRVRELGPIPFSSSPVALSVDALPRGMYWLCVVEPGGRFTFRRPVVLQ